MFGYRQINTTFFNNTEDSINPSEILDGIVDDEMLSDGGSRDGHTTDNKETQSGDNDNGETQTNYKGNDTSVINGECGEDIDEDSDEDSDEDIVNSVKDEKTELHIMNKVYVILLNNETCGFCLSENSAVEAMWEIARELNNVDCLTNSCICEYSGDSLSLCVIEKQNNLLLSYDRVVHNLRVESVSKFT